MGVSLKQAIIGACPHCLKGRVFSGILQFKDRCDLCGFDIRAHDNGDGPAFFVIVVAGFLVTGLAAWVEFAYQPPFWVHAVLWIPLILTLCIGLLRIFKALLLTAQYRHHLMEHHDDH